tara:strand:+ start:2266 stop:2988 length:723 start_codon:yes stop_codon:yes gene_type:complete
MSSSLDNLSIDELRRKVGKKHKRLCPPYSKWTRQQLIDHLDDNDTETDLNSSSNIVNATVGMARRNKKTKKLNKTTSAEKRTAKKLGKILDKKTPPSDWSPVKSEPSDPGFFQNVVDQFGEYLGPKTKRKSKRKSKSFHSSSSRYYKKSYKNLIRLTKPQLVRMANKKGLDSSGQKGDIARRIANNSNSSNPRSSHSSSDLRKTKKQLLRLTKKQLQRLAHKKGVNPDGKKEDLINRIKD